MQSNTTKSDLSRTVYKKMYSINTKTDLLVLNTNNVNMYSINTTRGSQEPVSFTWSYVKTMSCSGSHLGITINIKNTKFVKDLPMIDV
jgi:hypothetical protein